MRTTRPWSANWPSGCALEQSRVLLRCMSVQAFSSDWSQLDSGTFRFRSPLNQQRRFIPLRLDDAPIKGSLAQFLSINWLPQHREPEYAKLLDVFRWTARSLVAEAGSCKKGRGLKEKLWVTLDYGTGKHAA